MRKIPFMVSLSVSKGEWKMGRIQLEREESFRAGGSGARGSGVKGASNNEVHRDMINLRRGFSGGGGNKVWGMVLNGGSFCTTKSGVII